MKPKIFIFGILIIIIALAVGGCRNAGLWLVKKDKVLKSDVIVLLMGSIADRVLQTVNLYRNEFANEVLLVEESTTEFNELKDLGVNVQSTRDQIRNALIYLGIPAERIVILNGNAQSTQDEAIIIRQYLTDKPDIDTLLLVSSSHHARRATLIFKNVFRKSESPVFINCSPNSYTSFNAEKWWKNKDDIETVLLEYLKIVNFLFAEKRELK